MDIDHENNNNNVDDALNMAPSTKVTNTSKESKKNDQFNKKTSVETTDALSNSMIVDNATSACMVSDKQTDITLY
jgi:hypothetical protein